MKYWIVKLLLMSFLILGVSFELISQDFLDLKDYKKLNGKLKSVENKEYDVVEKFRRFFTNRRTRCTI